jgi:hypothetical protein
MWVDRVHSYVSVIIHLNTRRPLQTITVSTIFLVVSPLRVYSASVLHAHTGSAESLITVTAEAENNIVTVMQMWTGQRSECNKNWKN